MSKYLEKHYPEIDIASANNFDVLILPALRENSYHLTQRSVAEDLKNYGLNCGSHEDIFDDSSELMLFSDAFVDLFLYILSPIGLNTLSNYLYDKLVVRKDFTDSFRKGRITYDDGSKHFDFPFNDAKGETILDIVKELCNTTNVPSEKTQEDYCQDVHLIYSNNLLDPADFFDSGPHYIKLCNIGDCYNYKGVKIGITRGILNEVVSNIKYLDTRRFYRPSFSHEHVERLGEFTVETGGSRGRLLIDDSLIVKEDGLYGNVEFTLNALESLRQGKYLSVSPELHFRFWDHSEGRLIGPVIRSFALTNKTF